MTKFSFDSFTEVQPKTIKEYWWNQWSLSLSMTEKEAFFSELSLLLTAQIPLKEALQFIQATQTKKKRKRLYEDLLTALNNGKDFYQALKKQKGFSLYEWNIIKIGEETGALTKVVASLANYFKEKNTFRRNLSSALVYPSLLLLTASFVVVFMLTTIVPLFEHLFTQQNLSLPRATQWVINLSNFIKNKGLFGFVVCWIL